MNDVSLEQRLTAELNRVELDKLLIEQPYEFKSIFLNRIQPDSTNPRFLPVIIIPDLCAYQVATKRMSKSQLVEHYGANNKVFIGKSCIVNCFKYGSQEWRKANETITSIIELAENVAVSEIIQVPTLFPLDRGNFQILTGHRRFFAMVYANGIDGAAHFKVYNSKPILPKTKQFQENASREDLPQYGKLQAFQDAMLELETLSNMQQRKRGKSLTVKECASILGCSMGAYDNYNVLTRYPAVLNAYHNGNSLSFVRMKKLVLSQEALYKSKYKINILNVEHKREINAAIKNALNGTGTVEKPVSKRQYRFGPIDSPELIKVLLTQNVLEIDTGVDWHKVDWSVPEDVNAALKQVIDMLSRTHNTFAS